MEKEEDSFFVLPKKYINGTYSWNGNVKKNFFYKVLTTCKFQITLKMFTQWYLRNVELTFQSFAIMCLCPNFSFSYFFLFWSAKIPLDFLNWKLTLLFISLWLSLDYECCIYSSQDIFKKTFQSALSVLLTYTSYSRRKEETTFWSNYKLSFSALGINSLFSKLRHIYMSIEFMSWYL